MRTRTLRSLILAALLLVPAMSAVAQTVLEPRPVRKGYKRVFTIDSTPQTATIYLDDRKYGVVGYTPYKATLTDGDYKLMVELKGYQTEERTLRVQKGIGEQLVVLHREIAPGTIKLMASDPNVTGAALSIDGVPKGQAPIDVKVLIGRHLIEMTKAGYQPFVQWVEVEEGQVVALAPVLRAIVAETAKGSLLIDSVPNGAEVALDGRRLPDRTPMVVDSLSEGLHVIEVNRPPAKAWKDTIYVKAGERAKLTATLEMPFEPAPLPPPRPTPPPEPAPVPQPVLPLPPPPVVTPEKAPEKPPEKAPEVAKPAEGDGAQKPPTEPYKAGLGRGTGLVRVVSPLPDAEVFIDGAKAGLSPVEKELTAGKHFIMVRKDGFADFTREIEVYTGLAVDLTATLLPGGGLRVIASKDGAKVNLDGKPIGVSPAEANNVEAGEHLVTVELEGYEEFRTKVTVAKGERAVVNADLKERSNAPTMEELKLREKGISTWGARPMALGNFAVDLSAGYPVWGEVRALVGFSDARIMGWDLGIGIRSYFNNWEIFATGRVRFVQAGPFSVGAFLVAGGGAGVSDGRNTFSGQGGVLASLNFADVVTIGARVFADVWSDQLCPNTLTGVGDSVMWICKQTGPAALNADRKERLKTLTGLDDPSKLLNGWRDTKARAFLSLTIEVAVAQNLNLFLIFEGAPGQAERAMDAGMFNSRMLGQTDPIYNGRLGATIKY